MITVYSSFLDLNEGRLEGPARINGGIEAIGNLRSRDFWWAGNAEKVVIGVQEPRYWTQTDERRTDPGSMAPRKSYVADIGQLLSYEEDPETWSTVV